MKHLMKKNFRISFLTVLNLTLFTVFTVSSFAQYCVQNTTFNQVIGGGIQFCRTRFPASQTISWPTYPEGADLRRGLHHVWWRSSDLIPSGNGSLSVCDMTDPANIITNGRRWGDAGTDGRFIRCSHDNGTILSASIVETTVLGVYDVVATVICIDTSIPIN